MLHKYVVCPLHNHLIVTELVPGRGLKEMNERGHSMYNV